MICIKYQDICSMQSENLRILRIPRLRSNLKIAQHVCAISRLCDLHAQSMDFELWLDS